MLYTVLTDDLKMMGASREIITNVQKLRKAAQISIDDKVDIFYELDQGDEGSFLNQTLKVHLEEIKKAVKMPFSQVQMKQSHVIELGETEYVYQEGEKKETMKIRIGVPAVVFNDESLTVNLFIF